MRYRWTAVMTVENNRFSDQTFICRQIQHESEIIKLKKKQRILLWHFGRLFITVQIIITIALCSTNANAPIGHKSSGTSPIVIPLFHRFSPIIVFLLIF